MAEAELLQLELPLGVGGAQLVAVEVAAAGLEEGA